MEGRECALLAGEAAADKKAEDLIVLSLDGLTVLADYFVIGTGQNPIQVRTIADHVQERLREKGRKPRGVEGYDTGRWVLLDYGDVVVHVFQPEDRRYYGLERLWGDAARIDTASTAAEPSPGSSSG